ncbi:cuticle protein 19-like [Toxorhynchites rutilus septentrionalis]|uniref:cuticle protein 19-like n=1 Tax=Toxorhynchites rutilus septentrionalis TaxID=329112 RepID=UPI00247A18D6|nr:cuticle protein 19-like [Toxorhynchites rutilus septentrionalis]
MAFKFFALYAVFAVATAQHYDSNYYQQPQYNAQPALLKSVQPHLVKTIQPTLIKSIQPTLVKSVKHVEYPDTPAQYQFAYEVHDDHTGDIKSHHEERHGDNVKGYYTLIDADGHRRIVEYSVDGHSGFNAVVRREPLEGHKIVKAVAPVAKIVAPVHHYQPAPAQVHIQQAPIHRYQSAPVQLHYQPTPVQHYQPAPVKLISAPVTKVALPAVAKVAYDPHHGAVNHVQFSGLSSNYQY